MNKTRGEGENKVNLVKTEHSLPIKRWICTSTQILAYEFRGFTDLLMLHHLVGHVFLVWSFGRVGVGYLV